ncbi:BTAD domain-containing putative transcriptional regulator [Actinomycetes bacterium KLBMP 9797]
MRAVSFRLLGEIEARVDDHPLDLGHARQRGVLAAMLIDVNQPVTADQLLERVWGDRLPQRPRNALSAYLSRLRAVLADADHVDITRQSGAYLVTADPMVVDLHRFRDLTARARAADDAETGESLLRQALALWRGEALAALDSPWVNAVRHTLDAERLAAELDHNDVALALGRHVALLGRLSAQAAAHPLDERLSGQLILALYRCGRQADALEHYERVRLTLAEELGADPSPPLRHLHRQILVADAALAVAPPRVVSRVEHRADPPVPRQLPAPLPSFAHRARELAELDAVTAGAGESPAAAVVVLSGTAGVGKTTLAVHWAHRVADRFPDGQLYVDLRGFAPDGSVKDPAEVLREFLIALGVPVQSIPSSVDIQAGLYRSLMAGRRVLVVLDNVRDVQQVSPLLPGTPGCHVVVTSRNELTGLAAAQSAHLLPLDLLSPAEARDLLARRLGRERVTAEPAAMDQIVTGCARLPLALAILAARAAARPGFPLTAIVADLRDASGGLDAFTVGDTASDLRAVFSWSYQALSDGAAQLFRLLGLHPGPDIGAPAAASLCGVPLPHVRPLLAELTRASLVMERAPGRYAFHDLLRAYAVELAHTLDKDVERDRAVHRLLDHYLHTAYAADERWDPSRHPIGLAAPQSGVTPERLADHRQALAWFTAEREVLLAVIRLAAGTGFDTHLWQLAWTLADFFDRRGHWHDWAAVLAAGLAAARRLGDGRAAAYIHRGLGRAHTRMGEFARALSHLRRARYLFTRLDDRTGQAHTQLNLAWTSGRRGSYRGAIRRARRALDLYGAAGHRVGRARALNSTGWYHAQLGEHRLAVRYCGRALTLLRAVGDRRGEANTADSLGYIHYRMGRPRAATAWYQRAVYLFRQTGDPYYEADTLTHLGDARRAVGDIDGARRAWRDALAVLEQLGHLDAVAVRARLATSTLPNPQ